MQRDRVLREELDRHLSILKRTGLIRLWHDGEIDCGAEWAPRIHQQLDHSHLILLLISADFLASSFCYAVEMKRAIARHSLSGLRVYAATRGMTISRSSPADWNRCFGSTARHFCNA